MTKEVRDYRQWVKGAFQKKISLVYDLVLKQQHNQQLQYADETSNEKSTKSSGASAEKQQLKKDDQSNKENKFSVQVNYDIKMLSNHLAKTQSAKNLTTTSNELNAPLPPLSQQPPVMVINPELNYQLTPANISYQQAQHQFSKYDIRKAT
jgi:hypothetical protein